jgi:hypothetical protein
MKVWRGWCLLLPPLGYRLKKYKPQWHSWPLN